jgi:hypothetical protein
LLQIEANSEVSTFHRSANPPIGSHKESAPCIASYWHDQTEEVIDTLDCREEIAEDLLRMKQAAADQPDQRFIYFICSRKRIRFSRSFPPQYSAVTRQLTYYLEVGADKELMRMTTPIRTIIENPKIRFTERVLSYQQDSKSDIMGSVHEFHHFNAIELGLVSNVHYIGTKAEEGLAGTLRNVSREENDIFHYYNVFRIGAQRARADHTTMRFEGQLLEDVLVYYFKPGPQRELAELKARIATVGRDLNVGSVAVKLQSEYQNEYFRFGSATVPAAGAHRFWLNTATSEVTVVTETPAL